MGFEVFRYASDVVFVGSDRRVVRKAMKGVLAVCRSWKLAKLASFIDAVAELVVRNLERKGAR